MRNLNAQPFNAAARYPAELVRGLQAHVMHQVETGAPCYDPAAVPAPLAAALAAWQRAQQPKGWSGVMPPKGWA